MGVDVASRFWMVERRGESHVQSGLVKVRAPCEGGLGFGGVVGGWEVIWGGTV